MRNFLTILLLVGIALVLSLTVSWAPPEANTPEESAEGLGTAVPESQVVIPEAPKLLPPPVPRTASPMTRVGTGWCWSL